MNGSSHKCIFFCFKYSLFYGWGHKISLVRECGLRKFDRLLKFHRIGFLLSNISAYTMVFFTRDLLCNAQIESTYVLFLKKVVCWIVYGFKIRMTHISKIASISALLFLWLHCFPLFVLFSLNVSFRRYLTCQIVDICSEIVKWNFNIILSLAKLKFSGNA